MQQPTQQELQAFQIMLKKELDQPFPKEFIPEDFCVYAEAALQHESVTSLQTDTTTYEKIIMYLNGDIELNFWEIPFLVNSILNKTPAQLTGGRAGFEYLKIIKEVNELSKKWNEIVEPIKEATQRKVKSHIIRGLNPMNGKMIKL